MDGIIEVCVDSVESALQAQKGGADRLELCSDLIVGGTTASVVLFRQIRKMVDVPIHVLLRPRYGDFYYSEYEYQRLLEEAKMFREQGADGIVIGLLQLNGHLDTKRLKQLIDLAKGMKITLHRAFDMCKDPRQALMEAIALGVDMILTSGQQNSCFEGRELIKELISLGRSSIRIMAGGGMHPGIAAAMYQLGVRDFHLSGKIIKDSDMSYRKTSVTMGMPIMSEYERWETDADKIRAMRQTLDQMV
jgi:copper homeostasis protein